MVTTRRHALASMAALLAGGSMPPWALAAGSHEALAGQAPAARALLGTSAVFDRQQRLWVVQVEPSPTSPAGTVLSNLALSWSGDNGQTWHRGPTVLATPEAVEANGEGRPKLAFGTGGQVYITYTSPLAKPHTGNIRFVRSTDDGQSFTPPVTVQRDLTPTGHRFDSIIVDGAGRIFVAWIDKRDLDAARAAGRAYRGASVYYAVSTDHGASFGPDIRLAEHCCECCRIALALDADGRALAMWRHIFAPNIRDHAMAVLAPEGKPGTIERVSFEDWRIDACPHHGPSLAFDGEGRRHQVWFSAAGEGGGVFYSSGRRGKAVRIGGARAEHGEVMAHGTLVAIVWKEFDGQATQVMARWSSNGGKRWQEAAMASSAGTSDHPHLARGAGGIWLVWRTQNDGVIVRLVGERA